MNARSRQPASTAHIARRTVVVAVAVGAVDRRFDRARYDAQRTVADFSDRLREEVDIATVTTDLHATIRDAVKPTSVQLWIREVRS